MKLTKQLLDEKARPGIFSVSPDTTVYRALEIMADKDIGALLVMDGGKLVGIFSERDYARKVVLKGRNSLETKIREVMTGKVVFVKPNQTIDDCMALMSEKRFRHLPVMEGDEVLGVLSITDIVRAQISQREFEIKQLENYIMG